MRWFGPSWNAPVCEEGEHVATPVGELCEHCGDAIENGEQGLLLAYYDIMAHGGIWSDFPVHLDCLMKMVTTP